MGKSKEIGVVRKRNAELLKQIIDLKLDIELNKQSSDKAKGLITDFETMKQEWQQIIDTLTKKRDEYDDLIEECKKTRNEIVGLKKKLFQKGDNK